MVVLADLGNRLSPLIVLWPVTLVLFLAIAISAVNFEVYRRLESNKKSLARNIAIYAGAAVIALVCIGLLLPAGAGCC